MAVSQCKNNFMDAFRENILTFLGELGYGFMGL